VRDGGGGRPIAVERLSENGAGRASDKFVGLNRAYRRLGPRMKRFCFVGAGFSGAVMARAFAEAGHQCLVIDERKHIAGNCYTERDSETGVMTHVYGPHIFHTDDEEVWAYIQRFSLMMPYVNRVKAVSRGRVYTLPVNLLTINQFFGQTFRPNEARAFLESQARLDIADPKTFEDQALRFVGEPLYKAFFEGYTQKQWGCEPSELPASILKRLPLRFNYDDNYFSHRHQGMPEHGYTEIVAKILDVAGVETRLQCAYESLEETFEHIFYSGPLDRYFEYSLGRLGYRTLDFESFRADGDYQGAAVINYCDREVPYTRITEHKHFSPWEADRFSKTICFREFSRACGPDDTPYYPIRLANEHRMLGDYTTMANQARGVSFVGRLGTYRYLDMDTTIHEALCASREALDRIKERQSPPAFMSAAR
jgi:UDP-galactopyranose mutase